MLAAPSPGVPQGFPRTLMSMPWWVTEQKVSADNHLREPHVHVDHQYVAIADSIDAVQSPAHPFRWVSVDEMDGLRMFEDTRLLARGLFPIIADLAAGSLDVTGVFSSLGGGVG